MPLTEPQRIALHKMVDACREELVKAVSERLQAVFGIHQDGRIEPETALVLPDEETEIFRRRLVTYVSHRCAQYAEPDSMAAKQKSVERLTREAAFTHLNRLCAYKMLHARKVIEDPIGKGLKSRGFLFYCGDYPDAEKLLQEGKQEKVFRQFLEWQAAQMAVEMAALFAADDPAAGLYPKLPTMESILERLNAEDLKPVWQDDETIGWVYQFFTTDDERKKLRKEHAAPQNSYEMAVRNQFFTPRYIVEFLADNTLGRTWIEMCQGNTRISDQTQYLLRHSDTVYFGNPFALEDEEAAEFVRLLMAGDAEALPEFRQTEEDLGRLIRLAHTVDGYQRRPLDHDHPNSIQKWLEVTERDLLAGKPLTRYSTQDLLDLMFVMARCDHMTSMGSSTIDLPLYVALGNEVRRRAIEAQRPDLTPAERDALPRFVPYRAKKDPREIRVLDPACGSGHFLLYAFELFLTIYTEFYDDTKAGNPLREEYPDRRSLELALPSLILKHNLWGVDIDRRCAQIAALALALRAQRAWQEMKVTRSERHPTIEKTNIVCAEPMPGESDLFAEFARDLDPPVLADLVKSVFEKMKDADTLGSLLRIEDDLRKVIAETQRQYANRGKSAVQMSLEIEHAKPVAIQHALSVDDLPDEKFFEEAEERVLRALQQYAEQAVAQEESETIGLSRRLFARDTVQGFALVDLCHTKFDVVLMNPPFGAPATPSKTYIEATYGDTKGDVYKAFLECFQDRLVPAGYLGAITSRTGFFLGQSADWRARIILRLYHPLIMADLGDGVLDATVETAAYVLRGLNAEERRALTAGLAERLSQLKIDTRGRFTRSAYEKAFSLKRHQAEQEIGWLVEGDFVSILPEEINPITRKSSPMRYQIKAHIVKSAQRLTSPSTEVFTCLRLLAGKTNDAIQQAMEEVLGDANDKRRYIVFPENFKLVPGLPFAYWVSNDVRRLYRMVPAFEQETRYVQAGASTKEDFRFTRAWWEISPALTAKTRKETLAGKRWVMFSKGGGYSPFYNHSDLAVEWGNDGKILKEHIAEYRGSRGWGYHWTAGLNGYEDYFRPGLSWAVRTHRFAPHAVPSGGIFSASRYQALASDSDLNWLVGLMNAEVCNFLLRMCSEWYERPKFIEGVVARLPLPDPSSSDKLELTELGINCIQIKRDLDTVNETSHIFQKPVLLRAPHTPMEEGVSIWETKLAEVDLRLAVNQHKIDEIAFRIYGIKADDRRAIEEALDLPSVVSDSQGDDTGHEGEIDGDDFESEEAGGEEAKRDRRTLAEELISYAVGCTVGRFDVRLGAGLREVEPLPDPFAPLPVCSPGMLTGAGGLPCAPPDGYPLDVDADGVMVEDADERGTARHPDDIVLRVQAVLRVLFGERADAMEAEACQWLEVPNLRDYFRRSGTGGFWQDHIKRYSKSRRKAPIYWLLQSNKRSYSLWFYAHKLDADTLYKALLDYVEPALKRESDAQNALRGQVAALPESNRERRDLERSLEKQETIVGEMTDFSEKLREVAQLALTPDLNDGVVLTIAPLYKLVPWKEASDYWKALLAGKYPWANISTQLKAKRLVP